MVVQFRKTEVSSPLDPLCENDNDCDTKEQKVFEIGFQEISLNQSPLVVKYNLKQTEPAVDKDLIQTNLAKFQKVEKALRDLAYATYRIQSEPQEQSFVDIPYHYTSNECLDGGRLYDSL